jgi:ABC-type amino acid transport substrate-binding protein
MNAENSIDRRRFLKQAGLAAGLTAAAGMMAGCGAEEESAAPAATAGPEEQIASGAFGNILKEIRDRGKITIASTLRYPPQAYRDENNEPAGYDPELMQMLAADLEVELDLVDVEWAAILPGVASGKYDIAMIAVANKPSRLLTFDFTRGYVHHDQWLLVRADETATDWREMNAEGKKITAQIGATPEYTAREVFPKAEIIPLKIPECMMEVAAGRADGSLVTDATGMPFAKEHPEVKLLAWPDEAKGVVAREWGCIPVRKGEHAFVHYLDSWLKWYWERGTLPAMIERIIAPSRRGEVTWG